MKRLAAAASSSRALIGGSAIFGTVALFLGIAACLSDLADLPPFPDGRAQEDGPGQATALACGDGLIETLDDGGDAGESCDPGDAQAAIGCESCQFQCEGKIDDAGGHCYFLVDAATTTEYAPSVSACVAAGGHVATFVSDREVAFASAVVGADAGYWVGLSVNNNIGHYTPPPGAPSEPGYPSSGGITCKGCFAVGATDGGALRVHPDIDASELHQCVVFENGGWFQVPCNGGARPYSTLCEREVTGQRARFCGGPFCTTVPATVGSKRYVIGLSAATAKQAVSACKQYDNGEGKLAILNTREEREQLVREITALLPPFVDPDSGVASDVTVWIGLAYSAEMKSWIWDDGAADDGQVRPLVWGSGQPTEPQAGSSTARAFLRIGNDSLAPRFDTQLAYSDDQSTPRPYVCQRK